jgi:signal transduction histidine kinase
VGRPFTVAAGQVNALPLRALMVPLPDGRRLMVARDITPSPTCARMLAIFLWSGGAVICLATVAALALSLAPLRRIRQIHAIAQRIAAGDLGQRMPLSGRRDELDTVAATVNTMMGEIERLMVQVKGTTMPSRMICARRWGICGCGWANCSGRRQRCGAGRGDRGTGCGAGAFQRAAAHIGTGCGGAPRLFALFDPMAMLATAAELYEPLAEERGIALTLHGAFGHTIEGDEALVLEAIGNLLDNAIKFTPPGGAVTLAVVERRVALEVRDNGPGIPGRTRRCAAPLPSRRPGASRQGRAWG